MTDHSEVHSNQHQNEHVTHKNHSEKNYDLLSDVYDTLKSGKRFKVDHGEHGDHERGKLFSIRKATYKGHQIAIKTLYEIEIDGKSYNAHFTVDNKGVVRCHALPTYGASSVVDLIERLIDLFPNAFQTNRGKQEEGT